MALLALARPTVLPLFSALSGSVVAAMLLAGCASSVQSTASCSSSTSANCSHDHADHADHAEHAAHAGHDGSELVDTVASHEDMHDHAHVTGATTCSMAAAHADPALALWAEQMASEIEFPYVACFSEEKPPTKEVMAIVNAMYRRASGELFNTGARWSGTQGTPRALTWSFVPDGTQVPGLNNGANSASTLFASMDTKFGAANRATWVAQFQSVFDRWSAITGVSYTFVSTAGNQWDDGAAFPSSGGAAGLRGDIRISMRNLDNANGVLAFNYFPSTGDMVMDSSENWASTGSSYRFLRNTISHEHGHGLGIAHVCSSNSSQLMEPFLSTSFDGPQQDDLRATNFLYGDNFEPNNVPTSPTVLGALVAAGPALTSPALPTPAIAQGSSTSIDLNGDIDYFRVSVPEPLLVDVTLTPLGSNYDDNTQNTNGSCNSGTSTNALAIADLTFEARTSAGSVVLATANATAAGLAESLTGVLLSPAGDYLIRVSEVGSPTESQMYSLSVANPRRATISATDGTSGLFVTVSWTNVPAATSFVVYRSASTVRSDAISVGSVGAGVTTFNDTTPLPLVVYNYWVEAVQGGTVQRALAGPTSGFRTNPPPTAPANDNCVNALLLALETATNGTTVGATNDGSSNCGPAGLRDVYYSITAVCNSPIRITTDLPATNADTVLSVHSGCGATSVNTIACNEDAVPGGLQSTLTFPATAGVSYRIRVASKGVNGDTFQVLAETLSACNDIDFNNDGLFPDDADLIEFLTVLSGGACTTPSCDSIDFNNDGLFPDDTDLLVFLTVLSGGACPCS